MSAKERYESPHAAVRLTKAKAFLLSRGVTETVWVVAQSRPTARALVREVSAERGVSFGVESTSPIHLARRLASLRLAQGRKAPASSATLTALAARVLHRQAASRQDLGSLAAIIDAPGLPRALASVMAEVREAGLPRAHRDGLSDVAPLVDAIEEELGRSHLADTADIFAEATLAVTSEGVPPLVLLDLLARTHAERTFLDALIAQSPAVIAVCPAGDTPYAAERFDVTTDTADETCTGDLTRCQRRLFAATDGASSVASGADVEPSVEGAVRFFSAPGENRECVEVARRILQLASTGVRFDAIGLVVHPRSQYQSHLIEAFRRAAIPIAFSRGTSVPDPAGRALLALLDCASSHYSARAFAEYLAFGVMPGQVSGAPPPAREVFVADEERYGDIETTQDTFEAFVAAVREQPYEHARAVRVPRRFEDLLIDAAVIGERHRWAERLAVLEKSLALGLDGLDEPDGAKAARLTQQQGDLHTLRDFALPLLDELAQLPHGGSWRDWLVALRALATRALHEPDRVLQVLSLLEPMGDVGDVGLREVRRVLTGPLTDIHLDPGHRDGAVAVCTTEEVRGRVFAHVFVLGLAERVFPARYKADPLFPEAARKALAAEGFFVRSRRRFAQEERLGLRLAIGAAAKSVTCSWPRLDLDKGRPRVPSFYVLEVARALTGALPPLSDFEEAALRAGGARLGFPAPAAKADAIDDAEYDLAAWAEARKVKGRGALAYLLGRDPHLGRMLRRRARRWDVRKWNPADGFVGAGKALEDHRLEARAFSATGLQRFASCPYQFALHQILRLSEREVPDAIDQLDPRERGSLVHAIQFRVLTAIDDAGLWPLDHPQKQVAASSLLHQITEEVAAEFAEELSPAIERVWQDGVTAIETDLRRWLLDMDPAWRPIHYELSFGLPKEREQDPASVPEPVPLPIGIRLRGAIDLVEQHAEYGLRASDHKTGRDRTRQGMRIGGGEVLQPALYAMALEQLMKDSVPSESSPPGDAAQDQQRTSQAHVAGGRLYFCTSRGAFRSREVPLDGQLRRDVEGLAETVGTFLEHGFLPAHPASEMSCTYCDYRIVCGPHERRRAHQRKDQGGPIRRLTQLREKP